MGLAQLSLLTRRLTAGTAASRPPAPARPPWPANPPGANAVHAWGLAQRCCSRPPGMPACQSGLPCPLDTARFASIVVVGAAALGAHVLLLASLMMRVAFFPRLECCRVTTLMYFHLHPPNHRRRRRSRLHLLANKAFMVCRLPPHGPGLLGVEGLCRLLVRLPCSWGWSHMLRHVPASCPLAGFRIGVHQLP